MVPSARGWGLMFTRYDPSALRGGNANGTVTYLRRTPAARLVRSLVRPYERKTE